MTPVGTAERNAMAARLREDVLARLAVRPGQWVRNADLLPLAPEGRRIIVTELDDTPFGADDPRGPAYDAGGTGEPDGAMLDGVMEGLRRDLLAEMTLPLAWRLYDPAGLVGLGEIAARLGVKRDTADHWRSRGVLPEPDPADAAGRRPRWPWHVIRAWALATGRNPGGANAPRWNGVNGPGSGTAADEATSSLIVQ